MACFFCWRINAPGWKETKSSQSVLSPNKPAHAYIPSKGVLFPVARQYIVMPRDLSPMTSSGNAFASFDHLCDAPAPANAPQTNHMSEPKASLSAGIGPDERYKTRWSLFAFAGVEQSTSESARVHELPGSVLRKAEGFRASFLPSRCALRSQMNCALTGVATDDLHLRRQRGRSQRFLRRPL